MFTVETFYDHEAMRIRVRPQVGQEVFDQAGRAEPVDTTRKVQFPLDLRTREGLVFVVEDMRLIRPKNGAAAFYHAGGRIFGPLANAPGPYVVEAHRAPRSAEPFAAYVKPAAQGEPLRVRKITIK